MMKKRLITSALPYVNNIPHLGNLIQVLSADVFARYCRQAGYETLYVCGTDEYGTATETRAIEEGISPKELCDRYNKIHTDIYKWFNIQFDHFGRTSRPAQTAIVQNLFKRVNEAGYITEKTIHQLYCTKDKRFLADRYVQGQCPNCSNPDARGDQCENCGKLLEPTELESPRCGTCGSTPILKETRHLYIDLPSLLPKLQKWMDKAKDRGFWANNAIRMTEGWIRDGLKERAITRDLKWGIPVPKPGYEDKVFYVWFDAPIGYISITADYTDKWEEWWRDPDNTELFQFIGKDNIPFHTVIFPSTQLASGETWTMLHHMSSTEYLNYEDGKFSKSKGIGVFGDDCLNTGIPADVWRFYIYFNRPENSDFQFTWTDFQEKVNGELIGNFANLVNRTLAFICRFYHGRVPDFQLPENSATDKRQPETMTKTIPESFLDESLWKVIKQREYEITKKLEHAELRGAYRDIFALSDIGNKAFQVGEPWKTRTENPDAAAKLIRTLFLLIRDLSIMVKPYLPVTSESIARQTGQKSDSWDTLGTTQITDAEIKPEVLFAKLDSTQILSLKVRFGTTQADRKSEQDYPNNPVNQATPEETFTGIDLAVARIVKIEQHPNADKLYVLELDDGSEESRSICSGLVDYYTPEELDGSTIIIVANLKSIKLRGIQSRGMLLAAEDSAGNLEVLRPHASPGDRVYLQNREPAGVLDKKIDIKRFQQCPIMAVEGYIRIGKTNLMLNQKPLQTQKVLNGKLG